MEKFCDNKLCKQHVDVDESARTLHSVDGSFTTNVIAYRSIDGELESFKLCSICANVCKMFEPNVKTS